MTANLFPNYFPQKGATIVVAMSGGVDSSVSAAWLAEMGYRVIGVSLKLQNLAHDADTKFGGCCSLRDIEDARAVAHQWNFPFYVANREDDFEELVVNDFVHEYLSGRTPNPCVRCNQHIKFGALLKWAEELGADYLATGHFASLQLDPETHKVHLCRARDLDKDQSYFLFMLTQRELSRMCFPVGGLTKAEVRSLAQRLALPVASKADSQDLCFVQDRRYREFIEGRVAESLRPSGKIIDNKGTVLGEHKGVHTLTLGQKIGIPGRPPGSPPLYVIELDPASRQVVVGPEEALEQKHALVSRIIWTDGPCSESQPLRAKIRYRTEAAPAKIEYLLGDACRITFDSPQRAITPGQAIVFYDGNRVLGGGWIDRAAESHLCALG